MKTSLKIITIAVAAILALILTRVGISYFVVLIALGLILPFLTKDKKSAVISGVLYATISYILSYPSGLFLINYMPSIDIPVNVTVGEVFFNLMMGLMIPVIISIVLCFVSSLIGNYLRKLIKADKKEEDEYHFDSSLELEDDIDDDFEENHERIIPKTRKDLIELSPIQKAKNKRKFERE